MTVALQRDTSDPVTEAGGEEVGGVGDRQWCRPVLKRLHQTWPNPGDKRVADGQAPLQLEEPGFAQILSALLIRIF